MATHCPRCGTEILEGSPVCPTCFEPVQRVGILGRLRRLFGGTGTLSGQTSRLAGVKLNFNIKKSIKIRDTRTGEMQEYHSLEDVPVEYREKIQQACQKVTSGKVSNTISVKDAEGNVRIYHSLEELPPDVRALYNKALGQTPAE